MDRSSLGRPGPYHGRIHARARGSSKAKRRGLVPRSVLWDQVGASSFSLGREKESQGSRVTVEWKGSLVPVQREKRDIM